jgi:hypothetical protein
MEGFEAALLEWAQEDTGKKRALRSLQKEALVIR